MKRKNIVVIGGGTGVFTALSGLKHSPHRLSAIVTMADDGGSSGFLREEFGILPPGDIRRALVALSQNEQTLSELFTYRFEEGEGLAGHSLGNLLLTALERIHGSFARAVEEAGLILQIKGEVIPVTLDNVRLIAHLAGGRVIRGETNIDRSPRRRPKIIKMRLEPAARPNPKALEAIAHAHAIVFGPGDLYTSVVPNLLVRGVSRAIRASRAKKIVVVNVMTKRGETDSFSAQDFVEALARHLEGREVLTHAVVNTAVPRASLLAKYREAQGAELVRYDRDSLRARGVKVLEAPLIRTEGKYIRHDPRKLAKTILSVVET